MLKNVGTWIQDFPMAMSVVTVAALALPPAPNMHQQPL